ncbi:MAG: DUF58 domain-containing protein [Chloroflexi bacterium]|nr:DUF58 domain-containing protein [Chloroflexota bacterium]
MFNAQWVWLILLMVVIGLAMRQSGLVALAVLLGTIVPLAWLWNRYALRRIDYRRALSESRVFAGEAVDLILRVTNRKLLPLAWLRIEDEFPKGVTLVGEDTVTPTTDVYYLNNLLSLRWYERAQWVHHLQCDRRGTYPFGPARLTSGDLFGLFTRTARTAEQDWLIVYPRVRPLAEFGLPPKEPFGDVRATLRILEDPSRVIGVRDYGPGDAFKRIHWKATARRQELQVKVYEPTTTAQWVIVLNIATLPKYWQGIIPERLEQAISLAASLASYAAERRYLVGVVANGCWPLSEQPLRVLPGRDPDQLTRILEALAAVSSMPTQSLEELLTRESPNLPWGATLLVVTAVVTDEIMAAMLNLRDAGRRQVLIVLGDETPLDEIPGILTYRLSADERTLQPAEGGAR